MNAMPTDRRCDCGGTLEPSNVFPVELLGTAQQQGLDWEVQAVAFFGCRSCGEWIVLPATRKPDGTHIQAGEGIA